MNKNFFWKHHCACVNFGNPKKNSNLKSKIKLILINFFLYWFVEFDLNMNKKITILKLAVFFLVKEKKFFKNFSKNFFFYFRFWFCCCCCCRHQTMMIIMMETKNKFFEFIGFLYIKNILLSSIKWPISKKSKRKWLFFLLLLMMLFNHKIDQKEKKKNPNKILASTIIIIERIERIFEQNKNRPQKTKKLYTKTSSISKGISTFYFPILQYQMNRKYIFLP